MASTFIWIHKIGVKLHIKEVAESKFGTHFYQFSRTNILKIVVIQSYVPPSADIVDYCSVDFEMLQSVLKKAQRIVFIEVIVNNPKWKCWVVLPKLRKIEHYIVYYSKICQFISVWPAEKIGKHKQNHK